MPVTEEPYSRKFEKEMHMKTKKEMQTKKDLWGEPVIEVVPNDRIRVYHTRGKMSRSTIMLLTLGDKLGKANRDLAEAGPIAREIVRRLFDIRGIERLALRAYSADVSIGRAFTWEEIEPQILAVLKTALLE